MMPMYNLFMGSFRSLSLTLEQNKATIMTESMLQDFTITTAGKEAAWIALL